MDGKEGPKVTMLRSLPAEGLEQGGMMPAQRQPHGLRPSLWDARAGSKVGSESSQGCSSSKHR